MDERWDLVAHGSSLAIRPPFAAARAFDARHAASELLHIRRLLHDVGKMKGVGGQVFTLRSEARDIVDGSIGLRREAVETLALAFQDDPALGWIIPDPAARRRRLPRFFDWLFADHLRHGMVLAAPDRAAVTLWRLPGKVHHHEPLTAAELWRMLAIFGPAIGRADKVGKHLARHIPAGEDHLYLRYAAVHPQAQGKGWGGRAIRAGIAEANRLGVDVCLETAKPSNVAIYQRLGFAILEQWQVPGGPHFCTMLRRRD